MPRFEYNVKTGLISVLDDIAADDVIPITQFESDEKRYINRALAKDRLIAWMSADNMSRVRSAVWTVQDLIDLMADPEIAGLLELINTLSFELATNRITTLTNPLITPEIKASWNDKLSQHLYLG